MNYKPAIGDTGTFYPAHFPIDDGYGIAKPPAVRATIERIWTDTCVNLRCENGVLPTSVLVVDPEAQNKPSGYYFIPDALVHVVGEAAPATETKTYANGTTATGPAPLPETSLTVLATMTYTFDEFVQYGLANGGKPVTNGMPWSFSFYGRPVTHENDNLYIISDTRSSGGSLHFRRGDTLVVRDTGLQVMAPAYPFCKGANCGSTNGTHSRECIEEAAAIQGWVPTAEDLDQSIEAEIQRKGLTAPRVTPDEVEAAIVAQTFTVLPNSRTTVCQLTLDNGFTVEGISTCVSLANFDAEIGRRAARAKAVDQVWQLLAFRLQERLHAERITPPVPVQKGGAA